MLSQPLALIICLSAVSGIGLELRALMQGGASIAGAAWILAGYFTILTNSLLAILFGLIAAGRLRFERATLVAGVVAAIALVGVVFALLLRDLRTLAGATALANFLLHQLNPVLAVGYWLLFTPKGRLSWRDPLLWSLYPLAYLVYALIRGSAQGHYAYPFIDVGANGWATVIVNSILIAVGFVAAGELMVWLDRMLARSRGRQDAPRA